jgi:PadR family transcriptional regulator AphA
VRVELLAKLSFAQQQYPAAAHDLVVRQRLVSRQRLAELQQLATALEAERSYDWLVLRYRIGQLEATLAWLDLCTVWLTAQGEGRAAPLPDAGLPYAPPAP